VNREETSQRQSESSAASKTALITGITGQDGSYLAEFLLSKGYEVHGLVRRASTPNTRRIDHIHQDPHDPNVRLRLHYGDLSNMGQFANLIYNVQPEEIYNLGGQSHVATSFEMPEYTGDVVALGTTRLLEAVRLSGIRSRFYQASSSEMFGNEPPPQNEETRFNPRSPYACAKAYAYWMTVDYRDAHNLHASNGILFNHESPRRGETFVTRKITRAIAAIMSGTQKKLYLGNLDASRDWGFAPDYVEAMWLMLQQDEPGDYVIGTGEGHTVRDFLDTAFGYVDMDWRDYVEIDPRYVRPNEVNSLLADATKARETLGWKPKVDFEMLVKLMVDSDMEQARLKPNGEGLRALAKAQTWHGAPLSSGSRL
jgi:GDPmannose 4,6-dehydratase